MLELMSRISGFIARFIDENLNAARVLTSLLLLTLVVNGSLLLAQYAPPSGFDAPTPILDAAPAPEESGEPVPNRGDIAAGRPSAPLPTPDGEGRSSTVKGAPETLAAGIPGGGRNGDSETTAPELQLSSASTVSFVGLPSVLWEVGPDGILGYGDSIKGAPAIVGGGGPPADQGLPADQGPPPDQGLPADQGPPGGGGKPGGGDPPGGGGPKGDGGPRGGGSR